MLFFKIRCNPTYIISSIIIIISTRSSEGIQALEEIGLHSLEFQDAENIINVRAMVIQQAKACWNKNLTFHRLYMYVCIKHAQISPNTMCTCMHCIAQMYTCTVHNGQYIYTISTSALYKEIVGVCYMYITYVHLYRT